MSLRGRLREADLNEGLDAHENRIKELLSENAQLRIKLEILEGVLHRAYPFTESDEGTIMVQIRELTAERNQAQERVTELEMFARSQHCELQDLRAERSEITGLRALVAELEGVVFQDASYYQVLDALKTAQSKIAELERQLSIKNLEDAVSLACVGAPIPEGVNEDPKL